VIPLAFFSLAQTKLPNYVALELPALAILVARWFVDLPAHANRRGALAWTALVPVTIGGVAFAIAIFARAMHLEAASRSEVEHRCARREVD
jgi:4-amino-4-deoxy-L-arabinose transferase-like glycosyltransferase